MTAIGIDLGTTNSCAAVWRHNRVEVIKDAEGRLVTPSAVSMRANGEVIAGNRARLDAASNPEHVYRWVKRLIGRRFDDPQVAEQQRMASYTIAPADNGEAWVQGRERLHSPPEISGHILRKLKLAAELNLGKKVTKAVITVPAYFNNAQRRATIDAGRIADLEVIRIINEPTAAALALELDRGAGPQTIAVYDLGGGTFDLSILRANAEGDLEVIVSNGDTFLGGEDFDRVFVDALAERFLAEHGLDPRTDVLALARLKEAAEMAKCELSETLEAEIFVGTLMVVGPDRIPKDFTPKATRAELEALTTPLIDRTIGLCAEALIESGLTTADIDKVVLVGGQTRMPLVQAKVREFFGRSTVISPDPDQIVARGAAVMAAALTGQMAVDLEDVTPFSLGVQAANDQMVTLIAAQSKIPARQTVPFTTAVEDQDAVTIRLRQGNDEDPRECLPLGLFRLEGVRPDKSGRRIIDVTADIDADGVMTASARDRGSGRVQSLMVDTLGLSPRAVDRLAKLTQRAQRASPTEPDDELSAAPASGAGPSL